MRVTTFFGIKTMFGFGPNISKAVAAKPDGLLLHEPVFFRCSRSTSACGSTGGTLSRSKNGHTPDRTSAGGRSFFEIRAAPVSGTKPISCAAGLKRSTTTCPNRLAYPNSLLWWMPGAPCFRPENDYTERATLVLPSRYPRMRSGRPVPIYTDAFSPTRLLTSKLSVRAVLSASTMTWSPFSTAPSKIFNASGS